MESYPKTTPSVPWYNSMYNVRNEPSYTILSKGVLLLLLNLLTHLLLLSLLQFSQVVSILLYCTVLYIMYCTVHTILYCNVLYCTEGWKESHKGKPLYISRIWRMITHATSPQKRDITYTQTHTVQSENREPPQPALRAGRAFGSGWLGSLC